MMEDQSIEDVVAAAIDGTPVEPEAPAEPQEAPEITEDIPVPSSWGKEWRTKWGQYDPDLRRYISQREREASDKITGTTSRLQAAERAREELRQQTEELRQFREQHEPYSWAPQVFDQGLIQEWAAHGLTPDQGARQMLAYRAMLRENPIQGLLRIAQDVGVDLRQVGQSPQYRAPDPQQQGLMQEIAELRQWRADQERKEQERQAAEDRQKRDMAQKAFDEFRAKNEISQDHLRRMIPLVQLGTPLAEAYDQVRWADPAARQKLIEEQTRAAEEKAKKAEAERLAKSEAANKTSRSGSPTDGAAASKQAGSVDDAVRAAFDAAGA